jgi:multidrug efflux pump subunit AcrA (membrane-fusion protein)
MKNQLYLELKNAENQLGIASDESKQYTIRSQMDGMIFRTSKELGEMIRRGEVIAVVGQKDGFYLELNVDELDVNKVKVGQKVLVKIDAYPDKTFTAKVSQIFPMINKQQQSVKVDAKLDESLPGWFSGLALEANIIIEEKEKAIVIPKSLLLPGDSVLIETENGKQKVKVQRGIETLDEVEIIKGLDSTNRLIVSN